MASETVKNPSIAPTTELRSAYNEVKSFFSQQSKEFFANYDVGAGSQNSFQNEATSNFTSTILSTDGGFFTSDLFLNRNIAKDIGIKPLEFSKGVSGDVTCYWAKSDATGENAGYYKNLLTSINFSSGEITKSQSVQAADAQKDDGTEAYTVQENDSLSKIAQAKLGNKNLWKQIYDYDFNKYVIGDDPNRISPGQVLLLPPVNPTSTVAVAPKEVEQTKAEFFFNKINSSDTRPDALDNPHVSLYRYGNPYISVSSAASDYCNVFFNGIDNVNLSLCVPYLRINVIDRCSKRGNKYPSMSLISFLKSSNDKDDSDKIFFGAQPILFDAKKRTATPIERKLKYGNVIGMESFQSPSTLLPDPTQILDNPRRLDTSVPLMTLESLTVSIESNGIAALSKKNADLSIVLHDRSRLKDISTLVSAGSFSSLFFEIEWGWTHPHAAAQFNNPIGRYLNSLRIREIFAPVSYNMSLQNGGGMNINLRLVGGAAVDSVNCSVLTGNFVTQTLASSYFDRFVKSTVENDPILNRGNKIETRPVTTILTSKDRKGQLIKREFVDKILRFARQDDVNTSEKTAALITELQSIVNGTDPAKQYSNKDGIKSLEDNLKKINVAEFSSQVFEKMKSKNNGLNAQDFTSVGAYLTQMVGIPLASSGLYDEVQIHTFTFNDSAGAMAKLPISDACIEITDTIGKEDAAGSLYSIDSVSRALNLLTDKLTNPFLPTYMIEKRADNEKKDSDTTAATRPVAAQNSAASRQNISDQVAEPPDDFTVPHIKYILRSVPAKVFNEDSSSTADKLANAVVDNTRLIAQVIVYDANATPDPGVIVKAYDYVNKKSDASLTPDTAKKIAKSAYPSITYGSLNSVIESVAVSTDTNGAIQTQNIIEFGKSLYMDNVKSDQVANVTELTVFPVSVTVSMIGMPIIERGQEIYLDLGTGTTLDALYYVSAVRHDLRNMKFVTNLTLLPKGQGTVRGINSIIDKYKKSTENANP